MKPSKQRVRLVAAGLSVSLTLGFTSLAPAASQASPAPNGPPIIYQKARSFRVPFSFNPAERARRRELQLWSSDDLGRNWSQKGTTTPDHPAFTYKAEHDGEYWLAVRSLDTQGRYYPADDARIEPSMKVVVDTTPPSIVLEPRVRSASLASVRWEVHDDNPGESDFPTLEYRVEGTTEWLPVPVKEKGPVGVATWDTGYTEPLMVRATAVDRAGNKAESILRLGSSKPGQPAVTAAEPATATPGPSEPVSPATAKGASAEEPASLPSSAPAQASTTAAGEPGSTSTTRPTPQRTVSQAGTMSGPVPATHRGQIAGRDPVAAVFPSAQDVAVLEPSSSSPPPAIETPVPNTAAPGMAQQDKPFAGQVAKVPPNEAVLASEFGTSTATSGHQSAPGEQAPGPDLGVPQMVSPAGARPRLESPASGPRPQLADDPGVGTAALSSPAQEPASAARSASSSQVARLKVPGPQFLLDYAVDRAGPNGRPTTVELWVTTDEGKTWHKRGDDPDRASPILVNLDGTGTYGISLIARDANGLGDKPPAPGDQPKLWIEVDAAARAAAPAPNLFQRVFRR